MSFEQLHSHGQGLSPSELFITPLYQTVRLLKVTPGDRCLCWWQGPQV